MYGLALVLSIKPLCLFQMFCINLFASFFKSKGTNKDMDVKCHLFRSLTIFYCVYSENKVFFFNLFVKRSVCFSKHLFYNKFFHFVGELFIDSEFFPFNVESTWLLKTRK